MIMRSLFILLLGLMLAAPLVACDGGPNEGDEGGEACSTRDATACTPLYEPSWERVFTETIAPRCGTAGGACHASAAAAGGSLVVSDMAATRSMLLESGFVVPGDAACSELVVRLDIDDDVRRMPPGAEPLDEAERCAVARWVHEGALP